MALVRPGSVVQSVSGRLGAVVFSRQGGAPIVRTCPTRKKCYSAAALSARATFTRARGAWVALSEEERRTWVKAAMQLTTANRLGVNRQLSGFCTFVKCAVKALQVQLSPPTAPTQPNTEHFGQPPVLEVFAGGPATVRFEPEILQGNPNVTVAAQRLVSSHPGLPGQLWAVVAHAEPLDYELDFWDALAARLGPPQSTEWIRFEVEQWLYGWPKTITSRHLVQVSSSGPELVRNGNFQSGGTPPIGWTLVGDGTLVRVLDPGPTGNYTALWTVAPLAGAAIFATDPPDRFAVLGGQTYTLRISYRVVSGTSPGCVIGGNFMTPYQPFAFLPPNGNVWTTTSWDFIPDVDDAAVGLDFYSAPTIACEVSWDNISIRKKAP